MIISHKHRFIFIKTRKTASTSIEIALSAICGPKDVLTPLNAADEALRKSLSGRSAQNYHIPYNKYRAKDWLRLIRYLKPVTYYNHMPARQLKKYVSKHIWNSYYVFCFERHPIDKCISHYLWRRQKVGYKNFDAYLDSDDYQLIKGAHFYQDKHGKLLVDKVYKMEQMEAAFKNICTALRLPENTITAPEFTSKKAAPALAKQKATIIEENSHIILKLFAKELDRYKD